MDPVNLVYILLGMTGGAVVVALAYGLLSLKLFRLQFALSSVQQALLSLQGREKAQRRWSKDEELAQQLLASASDKNVQKERYANDPIPWGG